MDVMDVLMLGGYFLKILLLKFFLYVVYVLFVF